jgi:hypothetical protein
MEKQTVKNLGCMNGWVENPIEYEKCVQKHHMTKGHITTFKLANCYYRCYCDLCKIEYTVDSSD